MVPTFVFPAHKAVGGLAIGPHSVSVFNMEYHWFTAASLVSSSLDILYKQPVYVTHRLVPCYHYSHALRAGRFTNAKFTTTQPDQLAKVKCLVTESGTFKVIVQDFFVPQLRDLGTVIGKNGFRYLNAHDLKGLTRDQIVQHTTEATVPRGSE